MLPEIIDYEMFLAKARRLGVNLRVDHSSSHGDMGATNARLRKLIRDERLDTGERRVKILIALLTGLISLLGLSHGI